MQTVKSFSRKIAFILDEAALRRLDAILQSAGVQAVYSVSTERGVEIRCESIEELLRIENSKKYPINRIRVQSRRPSDIEMSFIFRSDQKVTLSTLILQEKIEKYSLLLTD